MYKGIKERKPTQLANHEASFISDQNCGLEKPQLPITAVDTVDTLLCFH